LVRLRVCPCFRFLKCDEFIEPVANRPWTLGTLLMTEKDLSSTT